MFSSLTLTRIPFLGGRKYSPAGSYYLAWYHLINPDGSMLWREQIFLLERCVKLWICSERRIENRKGQVGWDVLPWFQKHDGVFVRQKGKSKWQNEIFMSLYWCEPIDLPQGASSCLKNQRKSRFGETYRTQPSWKPSSWSRSTASAV